MRICAPVNNPARKSADCGLFLKSPMGEKESESRSVLGYNHSSLRLSIVERQCFSVDIISEHICITIRG